MTLHVTLFIAGMLTILLPCILPLLPIVLGVSISGRSKWRPLLTVLGMILSFVGFTFLLTVVLGQFVELADIIRIATNYILLLFGIGFAIQNRNASILFGFFGAFFFIDKGPVAIVLATIIGVFLLLIGVRIASKIQQLGARSQSVARTSFGSDSPMSAFIIGCTLGLVWVPCAGPALSFALTLVRDEPGLKAALALTSYAVGTGLPLLLIGYGGQKMTQSVRFLNRYTGVVKTIAGYLFIVTAIALQLNLFQKLQIWLVSNTSFGDIGTRIEESLFKDMMPNIESADSQVSEEGSEAFEARESEELRTAERGVSSAAMKLPVLPRLIRAPEFSGLGPWHNSKPFTLASLKGKVVLVDFWTYSCINCIRTLPYLQGYWEKFKETDKFVLIGVHSPEFTFEKSQKNVENAIREHGLTYPIAQDNDFATWGAFANRYWPAKYLIDAEGYVRYTHFGEGEYEETDLAIQSLLREIGVEESEKVEGKSAEVSQGASGPLTPEIYLGSRSWPAFGNSTGEPDPDLHQYQAPDTLVLNKYYLSGSWQLADQEFQICYGEHCDIRMKFQAGEINLVLGLEPGAKPVQASVTIDGKAGKTFTIDHHDLYNLFKGEYGVHDIVLTLKGSGTEAFAFTFGA